MGQAIELTARDGHVLQAYRAVPAGDPIGALVIVQEVFGLTPHIRDVVDRYAVEGFAAVAPAMFDRVERGLVLDYSELERGRSIMSALQWPDTLADVQAAIDVAPGMPAGVVGFCWGGTVAHVAASDLPLTAAVSYYGSAIVRVLDRRPKCPMLYHVGDADPSIPAENLEKIRRANPDGVFHVYAGAGHGFDSKGRASYSAADAALAFERSVAFLRERFRAVSDTRPRT